MKTAISLPDRVFHDAEKHARRMGKSRSQFYADAVSEYLLRHAPEAVTEAMNDACERLGQPDDRFVKAASRRILGKETW